ncbi:hypothetical protein MMC25_008215 [Agyrium rufum]|nr:hypothetical protein [Agyrium rufum]
MIGVSSEYGRRLIPNIIDERARREPDRPVYSIPISSANVSRDFEDISARGAVYSVPVSADDLSHGFRDISARDFANAVDRVAWWLEAELGKGVSFPTIGYIGPHDIRYALLTLGCIKAGYQALLVSPRNSNEAILALLKAADCNIWVLPRQQPKFLSQLLAQRPMTILNIAEFEEFLDPEPVPQYTYAKTFEEASEEPFCVLHTSGSTGHPKPIFWKHSMLATLDATRLLPEAWGRPPWTTVFEEGDRFYSAFPFFHSASVTMNILINAYYGTCNVLGPVNVTPSLGLIDALLDHARIRVWSIIPSIVDEIGESPAVHAKFKSSKVIVASGGPVTYESANKATQSVRVINITGTTEGIFMGSQLPDPEDWIYFSFHPYANFDFREIEPGVFEQFIVREEKYFAKFQGIFHTFNDIQEMSLKDLFTQHPDPKKPGLWRFKGRTDDVVVLSNGNKIHPKDVEAVIDSHPAVSACLVVGTGHFQASLLVELVDPLPQSSEARQALLDDIYATVQRTNASKPPYACITKETIQFAKADKPFARTDKNTVKRRMTVVLYEKEIEEFYTALEDGNAAGFATNIDASSMETTAAGLEKLLATCLPFNDTLQHNADFFHAGLDSVLAIRVAKCLRSASEPYKISDERRSAFNTQLVYANPTIDQLSKTFFNLVNNTKPLPNNAVERQTQAMTSLRAKYAIERPSRSQKTLGSKFITGDLSKPSFGIEPAKYEQLLQETTHVIHNQWPVNFNYGIASFEPQIQGVSELINFCQDSALAPSLFFVSTVATISHLRDQGSVAEEPTDVLTSILGGYGASKQVSELLLQDAFDKGGVKATICRVGQIAGPVLKEKGMWAKQEWVPTIIASSKHLGILPSTLGSFDLVDWIPVDVLAKILLELSGAAENRLPSPPTRDLDVNGVERPDIKPEATIPVYHAVNPKESKWADLLPDIQRHLGKSVRVVSWSEWVMGLARSQQHSADTALDINPGLKLLDFFTTLNSDSAPLTGLETERSVLKSRTLAGLEPVGGKWMETWLKQWDY